MIKALLRLFRRRPILSSRDDQFLNHNRHHPSCQFGGFIKKTK